MGPTNDVLDPRLLPPGSVGSISNEPYASNQYSNQPSSNEYKPELPYFGTQARNSSGDGLDNGAPQRRLTDDFDQDEAQQRQAQALSHLAQPPVLVANSQTAQTMTIRSVLVPVKPAVASRSDAIKTRTFQTAPVKGVQRPTGSV